MSFDTKSRDNGIKCMFVLIPTKEMVYNRKGEREKWKDFCSFLDGNSIKYVDTLFTLEEALGDKERPFFEVDPHLTSSGHKALAETLYPHISSVISLDEVLQTW